MIYRFKILRENSITDVRVNKIYFGMISQDFIPLPIKHAVQQSNRWQDVKFLGLGHSVQQVEAESNI